MGRVDVLVNNAIYQGPGTMDRILDLPLELAERCLVGDYLHPLLLTQLLLPAMLERGEGRLVNMLSEAAFTTPPAPAGAGGWGVAYAAAKAAFHRVTDMCHVEFAAQGIWAFSIAPGLTLTESMRASGMDAVLVGAGHVPAPPDVAGEVAAWLGDDPDAGRYAGQMVSSRKLCKELALVPGWPPPRPRLTQPAGAWQPHRVGERHQPGRGDIRGTGAERAVQLVERHVAEGGVRRLGQLVGQLLHSPVQGPAGVGDAPVAVQQAPACAARPRHRPTRPRSSPGCRGAPRPGSPWSRPRARAPPPR